MMKKSIHFFLLAALLCVVQQVNAQNKKSRSAGGVSNSPTPADVRLGNDVIRQKLAEKSLTKELPLRNIGPTVMSGRVVDIDVNPEDETHFFVAFASGGLWVTHNNGQSFNPLFDHELTMTIGDFAVDWNNNQTIWIGTGEVNSSRSSYSGLGIYIGLRDISGEQEKWTWKHSGLPESHHIGRIILHPENDQIAWVAALGHLYTGDENRGVYKTTDGGKTWTKVLYVGPDCGAVDLVIDPLNPDELFAATWERSRKAWHFKGNGKGSGVYHTTNGGDTWRIISHKAIPLTPDDPSLFGATKSGDIGRIGLAVHNSEKGKFIYAIVDNQAHREAEKKEGTGAGLKKGDFLKISKEDFLALNDSLLGSFLKDNRFDEAYTPATVKDMVRRGEIMPVALYDFLYDANQDLFDTPVVGAEVYRYDELTGRWNRTHKEYLDDVVFTYGYYFGVIHASAHDPEKLYIGGVPLLRSNDGGKTFEGINPGNVHADHHTIWENPKRKGHLINGSDGGVQISYDDGKHYVNCNSIPVGQFYAVQTDNADPYNVFGGLQDNGVWMAPHNAVIDESWKIYGKNPYQEIIGGDGMQIMVDQRNPNIIYTGSQFGNYVRADLGKGEIRPIMISHKLGERPLRWNWQTPILLSSFNQDIFYICSNKVHRSTDGAITFETLSGDLTKGAVSGNVPFGTITTISESPLRFGLLAVGSDDGLVHISRDNGYSWQNVTAGLPDNFWISRILHSSHQLGRIYVSLNGYRNDCFTALIYVSEDWGNSWKLISGQLPAEPVNVIKEDPADERILYAGTDHGLYLTLDRGNNWMLLSSALPAVAVHDLAIQHKERDLLIGTHGRSLWIADIEAVGKLPALRDSGNYFFEVRPLEWSNEWGNSWSKWLTLEAPEVEFVFYSATNQENTVLQVMFGELTLGTIQVKEAVTGLNFAHWKPSVDENIAEQLQSALNSSSDRKDEPIKIKKADDGEFYLPKGEYEVRLNQPGCSIKSAKLLIR
jgi:photosystem II stability/assembly factor-like uncharacterized protein